MQSSNVSNPKLIEINGEVLFASEKDLEDYIESYFSELFPNFTLIERQYTINNQRCDLLCCTYSNRQPVIIELKNEEDRGLVAQLTRYRKALLQQKPFADKIDYSLPVKLVAIAPRFHEDNFTDKEASKFEQDFEFLSFYTSTKGESCQFHLADKSYELPYRIVGLGQELHEDLILNYSDLSGACRRFFGYLDNQYQDDFLKLHSLFVSQPKVKAWVRRGAQRVFYSTGVAKNSKKLAEITNTKSGLYLYLWLPTATRTNKRIPLDRFGFVVKENESPLSQESEVDWVVCTNQTISPKEIPQTLDLSFKRSGMLKWCKPIAYMRQATNGQVTNPTDSLLIELEKGTKLSFEEKGEIIEWWISYRQNSPTDLGWYINLAIKTWHYRLQR